MAQSIRPGRQNPSNSAGCHWKPCYCRGPAAPGEGGERVVVRRTRPAGRRSRRDARTDSEVQAAAVPGQVPGGSEEQLDPSPAMTSSMSSGRSLASNWAVLQGAQERTAAAAGDGHRGGPRRHHRAYDPPGHDHQRVTRSCLPPDPPRHAMVDRVTPPAPDDEPNRPGVATRPSVISVDTHAAGDFLRGAHRTARAFGARVWAPRWLPGERRVRWILCCGGFDAGCRCSSCWRRWRGLSR